jgi:hypothetical protein
MPTLPSPPGFIKATKGIRSEGSVWKYHPIGSMRMTEDLWNGIAGHKDEYNKQDGIRNEDDVEHFYGWLAYRKDSCPMVSCTVGEWSS